MDVDVRVIDPKLANKIMHEEELNASEVPMPEDKPLVLTREPVMTPAKRFVMDALRSHCEAIHGKPLGETFHVVVDGVEVIVRADGWLVCESGGSNG